MKMRLLPILLLLPAGTMAQGQIAVAGKTFERAIGEVGAKGEWVVYEKGAPRDAGNRRWLTRQVLVELAPGANAAEINKTPGVAKTSLRGKYAVVEFKGDPSAALAGVASLKKIAGVRGAEPMLARQQQRRFTPDDPFFAHNVANPGYQWHLQNTGQNNGTAGMDVNVVNAWDSYKGTGIRIAIVDDGLEVTHPDLSANVDLVNDYDFNGLDDDPSPGTDDFHGTACAGVAAAQGNNALGGSGVAPEATLVGLRLIAGPTTDADEADAFAYKKDILAVKSNSWGPYDGAFGMGGPGPLSLAALQDAVTTGRGGKGTIFLWAAGNGNQNGDDSNYDGWANSPYAIAVSAINEKGKQSWYSEPGANILVCAPSSGGRQGITTTDRTGSAGYNEDGGSTEFPDYANTDYTNTFGGTSSATPAAAGVVALMLQANPNLTYRDVQEILVRTAVKNDEYDGAWVTNGGGFHFNANYGAGLVNAQAATTMAATWTNVAPVQTKTLTQSSLALPIPDADEDGLTRTLTVAAGDNLRLEHVTVQVSATHTYRGNLEWWLTSPSGVSARLARSRFNDTGADLDWTFMATHFWGERSLGDWKLQVIDRTVGDVGVLHDVTITFYGTPVSGGLPAPVLTSNPVIVGREGWALDYQITAANFPTYYDAFDLPLGLSVNTTTGKITGTPLQTGASYGTLLVSNATTTVLEDVIFYILPADPLLSAAVEQPVSTKIVPFGFGDFFNQSTTTHDGVDAAQSGEVDHEEYSGMEFTVNGPASLSFQWKVSSEKNYDYLVLAIDGWVRAYITGEVDWTQVTEYVGPGAHNVDIYYLKDQEVVKGQDAGWVDQIVITPTTTAPVITAETFQAYQGVAFRYPIEAINAPSSYSADNLPAGLTLHAPTGLIYGSIGTVGVFPVTIHATNTFGTSTETITFAVGTLSEGLAAVVDAPAQSLSSSGDLNWTPQWLYAHDGEDAARSGPIGDLQQSVMTTQVTGPAKVTFYWGVSSEADYDYLRFYIDDVEKDAIEGEVGWTKMSYLLPAGIHTLKWAYIKDNFTRSGLDSGFVDEFAIHHDSDGDGFYTDMEDHFGTSDNNAGQTPQASLSFTPGNASLLFPSVSGKDYRIEYSDDLIEWAELPVTTANGTSTTVNQALSPAVTRRFYRVGIPE
jgi:subtilisin family serine protease